jgi:hypothetical protein
MPLHLYSVRMAVLFYGIVLHFACAASNVKTSLEIVVNFETDSVAVAAQERAQIAEVLNRIRAEDWCTLHYAVVVGQHSSNSNALASERRILALRAKYVAEILQRYGLPASIITILDPETPISETLVQPRIVVVFEGAPAYNGCSQPRSLAGFRVSQVGQPKSAIERIAYGTRLFPFQLR